MISNRGIPIKVRKHVLLSLHNFFDTVGDVVKIHIVAVLTEFFCYCLDRLISRIAHGIHRVPEADDDFLPGHPGHDVGLSFVRCAVTPLDLMGCPVAPPCLGPLSAPIAPVMAE